MTMDVNEFADKVSESIEYHFLRWSEAAERGRFEDDGPLSKKELDQANGIATGLSIAQNAVRKCLKEVSAVQATKTDE